VRQNCRGASYLLFMFCICDVLCDIYNFSRSLVLNLAKGVLN